MRRFITAGLALSAITLSLAATNVAQAQLLNGGFETPVQGTGNFSYNTTNASWVFTGNSGISGNASAFTSGNPNAPEGVQVAVLQRLGSFSQTFTSNSAFLASISFQAAQRGNFGASTENFTVFLNNASLGSFTPGSTTYTTFTINAAQVLAGTNTLTFQGNNATGDSTAFIDNVRVAAPEPGSALLLVPGLLGLVGVVRRRRK